MDSGVIGVMRVCLLREMKARFACFKELLGITLPTCKIEYAIIVFYLVS